MTEPTSPVPSRRDGFPYEHPLWCSVPHGADWPHHSAFLGLVEISDSHIVEVELYQADGQPACVALVDTAGENTTLIEMTAAMAVDLGRALSAAGDILTASS